MNRRGDVLARIPDDNGKVIRCGHDATETVGPQICMICDERPATKLVQGETDSWGFEVLACCEECHDSSESSRDAYLKALDVPDRQPKPGHMFVVSETTNRGTNKDWLRVTDSFREATAYYRRIAETAEPHCGLYPANGVQELPQEEATRLKKKRRERIEFLEKEIREFEERQRRMAEADLPPWY